MTDRLTSLDVSFFYIEGRSTPMHVGGLAIFEPPEAGFDYDRLVALLEERISLVPRYRQKVRFVPGNVANPVWIDDPSFDITFHVRRSGLPRPGTDAQLLEFCARIQSRPLDRNRPLWEMYLIEGLSDGRFAVATKTHHSMVDGVSAIDIAQVMLDVSPVPRETFGDLWMPDQEPSNGSLIFDAVKDYLRRPDSVLDGVRLGVNGARNTFGRVTSIVSKSASAVLATVRPAPSSPLNTAIGEQRRIAVARTRLDDYKLVRTEHAVTVNDVVLATIAGALRGWLLFRGESVTPATTVRTMVPVSVRSEAGSKVSGLIVDLPVGEPNPVLRLAQIAYQTKVHKDSGLSVRADAIAALSGFAPPTLHALGARVAGSLTRRLFNIVVTNVPGPQFPLYAAGARLLEMFPIIPLGAGQALSIALTSYDGAVYYGLNGDRDAMFDLDVLASLIEESLTELVESSSRSQDQSTSAGAKTGARRGAPRAAPRPPSGRPRGRNHERPPS